jgi:hypothetical protein
MNDEIERASARSGEACPKQIKTLRMTTREASEYLQKAHGLKVAASSLNKARSLGGGPVFLSFGKAVYYEAAALDAWVAAKLSGPRRSTSDTGEAA